MILGEPLLANQNTSIGVICQAMATKKTSKKAKKIAAGMKNKPAEGASKVVNIAKKASKSSSKLSAGVAKLGKKSSSSKKTAKKDFVGSVETAVAGAPRFGDNINSNSRIGSIITTAVGIAALAGISFGFIPWAYNQTDFAQSEIAEKERIVALEQAKNDKAAEDIAIEGKSQVTITTNYGDLVVDLSVDKVAKTSENFLRLSHRGEYDGTEFHRMVKADGFNIIQGGDFTTGDGTGGYSAFEAETFEDEIWKVAPILNEEGDDVTNKPELLDPDLYGEYDVLVNDAEEILYPKGVLAMANSGPNTNGSQFFVMLTDVTNLSPDYSAFGKVTPESFAVLDKIMAEVAPESGESGDGAPSPSLELQRVVISD